MREISHTNPYTGESTGQLFTRGPVVAADGGRREAVEPGNRPEPERSATKPRRAPSASDSPNANRATMRDVSHTPPDGADGANRVFERGEEGRPSNRRSN